MLAVILILGGVLAVLNWRNRKIQDVEKEKEAQKVQAKAESQGASEDGKAKSENQEGNKTEEKLHKKDGEYTGISDKDGENSALDATEIVRQMTLEEKVAQIFFVRPEAITGVEIATVAGETTRDAYNLYPVGGIVYFAENIQGQEQIKTMLENTQNYAIERMGFPVFLGVDEEGGRVARIAGNPNFQVKKYTNMKSIGESGDAKRAYEVGKTISDYLKELGFNMDFAPVADVISNSSNQVIGDRSFGTDAALVGNMAVQEVKGFQDNGMSACLKHFPGHGGTEGDTHEGFAYTKKTLEELKTCELVPFAKGIEADVDFLMTAHISVPNVIGDDTPASMSSVIMTDLLRNEMGYKGIIITDAMDMGAIVNNYSSREAALAAFQAGADMLLMPANFQEAYEAIVDGVKGGNISMERLDASVERIVRLKLEKNKS